MELFIEDSIRTGVGWRPHTAGPGTQGAREANKKYGQWEEWEKRSRQNSCYNDNCQHDRKQQQVHQDNPYRGLSSLLLVSPRCDEKGKTKIEFAGNLVQAISADWRDQQEPKGPQVLNCWVGGEVDKDDVDNWELQQGVNGALPHLQHTTTLFYLFSFICGFNKSAQCKRKTFGKLSTDNVMPKYYWCQTETENINNLTK